MNVFNVQSRATTRIAIAALSIVVFHISSVDAANRLVSPAGQNL